MVLEILWILEKSGKAGQIPKPTANREKAKKPRVPQRRNNDFERYGHCSGTGCWEVKPGLANNDQGVSWLWGAAVVPVKDDLYLQLSSNNDHRNASGAREPIHIENRVLFKR